MQEKAFHREDRIAFVKCLYDYSSRGINAAVKAMYAQKTGMTEKTFRDKMCSHRSFRDHELDVIENAFKKELGEETFARLRKGYIDKKADGDRRTIEDALDNGIAALLAQQNEELATAHLLL